jgi:hypothetical protein
VSLLLLGKTAPGMVVKAALLLPATRSGVVLKLTLLAVEEAKVVALAAAECKFSYETRHVRGSLCPVADKTDISLESAQTSPPAVA